MSSPFRSAHYGATQTDRALRPEEVAHAEAQRAAAAPVPRGAASRILHAAAMLPLLLVLAIGLFQGPLIFAFVALVGLLPFSLADRTRRRAEEARAARRAAWTPPEGGFRMRETRVRARSVLLVRDDVRAAGRRWALFEIPGEDWFFLDGDLLAELGGPSLEEVARAEVEVQRHAPGGPWASIRGQGAPLPQLGDAGERTWAPPRGPRGEAYRAGFVPPSRLPAWICALVPSPDAPRMRVAPDHADDKGYHPSDATEAAEGTAHGNRRRHRP